MEETHYLLIDTNVWIDLIEADLEMKILFFLTKQVDSGKINLMMPDTLMSEWNRKKSDKLLELKNKHQETLDTFAKHDSPLHYIVGLKEKEIIKAITIIDELLNTGVKCLLTDDIKLKIMDRQINRLAPFHNHLKTLNDALIFFTSIEFCKQNKINEFTFVSADIDFRESKESLQLHPQLRDPDIGISFYRNIGSGIGPLMRVTPSDKSVDTRESVDYVAIYDVIVEKIDHLHLIDQLNIISEYFKQQHPFIPTRMLSKISPFKIENERYNYTYASSFSLHTNNKALFDMITSIRFKDGHVILEQPESVSNVKDVTAKVKKIFNWLTSNLVFYLHNWEARGEASTQMPETVSEPGIALEVFKLNLNSAVNSLATFSSEEISEIVNAAYYNSYFGNFDTAMLLYGKALTKLEGKGLNLLSFICIYNIKQLNHLMASHVTKISDQAEKIRSRYARTSLQSYALKFSLGTKFETDLIKFLNERTFINDALEEIENLQKRSEITIMRN